MTSLFNALHIPEQYVLFGLTVYGEGDVYEYITDNEAEARAFIAAHNDLDVEVLWGRDGSTSEDVINGHGTAYTLISLWLGTITRAEYNAASQRTPIHLDINLDDFDTWLDANVGRMV